METLRKGSWQTNHNTPFKGGYLTRSKGDPAKNIHALQLEMCKDLYMKNDETKYDLEKAVKVRKLLKAVFARIIANLKKTY